MSNKIKRSEKYDFFKGTSNNEKRKKTPKEKFKLSFKWIKVIFYIFLLGLSLTGCVQSIAIKSSSTTGSGIEFYRNKNDIAPFVTTYKIVNQYPLKDSKGNPILNEDGTQKYQQALVPDLKENFLVTNKNQAIDSLKNQISIGSDGIDGLYGEYDNLSSSLRILNTDNELLSTTLDINSSTNTNQLIRGTNAEQNFIFMNSSMLKNMNQSTSYTYDLANKLLAIPIFVQKKPTVKPTDPIKLKEWENAKLGGKFQAYREGEVNPVKINDIGQYLKPDGTIYDISNQDDINLIEQFKYSFEFEKIILKVNLSNSFASEKFSRDYLQSLVNVVMQFDQLSDIDKIEIPEIPVDLDKEISITEKRLNTLNSIKSGTYIEPTIDPKNQLSNSNIKIENALYSNSMRKAILNYQSNIAILLSGSGYSIPKLNFSDDPDSDSWENSKYNLEFQPTNKSSYNFLYNGSTIGQKPIVTWGDAWGLGPFYGFVVYPISYIVNGLVGSLPSSLGGGVALLSIVISVIAARMLTLLLTYKSVFAQAKQQGLAPKKAKIDAKYAAYKGNKQMEQKKRQETSELYKKNNINMLTPLLSTLVSMPIFLSMWRIIQGIPFIKSTSLWGINFSQTSWRELLSGEWQYLVLIILAVVVQAGSQFLPRYLNKKRMNERSNIAEKEAMKKANKTQNIIMIIFVGMAIIFEAGVQIYWIVGGIWMMIQTLLIHHIQKTKFFKEKLIKYV